ncbi:MAG TPA: LLM class F420-dependent oxidoreductase [Acidimicrobiales bacterium]
MKFGLPLFGVSPRFYAPIAKAAEDNGFESIWLPEHLVFPEQIPPTYLYTESGYPPVTSDTALFDVWVALSNVAQATSSIRLGTNVYILPLRHPIEVARSVVTLDRLSNGRVTLGVGVGWLEDEFLAVGRSFHDRGRRADVMIPLLRRLWSEDVVEHHDEHFDIPPVKFQPKPRFGSIPIEVGGASAAALRRAGRLGDGWIEIGSASLDDVGKKLEVIAGHRRDAGREDLPFEVTLGAAYGRDIDGIRRCEEAGATRVVVGPSVAGRIELDDVVSFTKRFADEVISRF